MTSTNLPSIGDVIGGRYKIQSVIASGGMGVVMRGQHVKMGREVAVKFLHSHLIQDTDIRQRFEREVDIAKDLTHPNVVHVYDYGETPAGNLYLVMEYLEGNDLKHVLQQEQRFTAGRALNIMIQILDGLAEAHIRNIVHRDLKPANLFMTTDRHGNDLVKILDFGIAKSLQADQGITKTGTLCGTVAYMAPEAILAGGDTPSCDVYAAGLILLEMLTGKRAFRGESVAQTMMMQLQHNPAVPPRLEQTALGQLIRQATDKNPDGRFRDADGMLLALRQIAPHIDPNLRLTDEEVPFAESDAAPSLSDLYKPRAVPSIPIPTASGKAGAAQQAAQQTAQQAANNEASTQHISLENLEWDDNIIPDQITDLSSPPGGSDEDFRPTVQLDQPASFFSEIHANNLQNQSTHHSSAGIVLPSAPMNQSSSSTSTSLSHQAPRSRKTGALIAAIVLAVAAIAGGIIFVTSSKPSETIAQPTTPTPPAAVTPPPAEVAAIEPQNTDPIDEVLQNPPDELDIASGWAINLQTTPTGAELFLDEVPLGPSPIVLKLKPEQMPAELRIVLDGFQESTQFIENTSADSLHFVLEPVPTITEVASADAQPEEPGTPAAQPAKDPAKTTEKAPASTNTAASTKKPTGTKEITPAKTAAKSKEKDTEKAAPNVDDLLNKYLD